MDVRKEPEGLAVRLVDKIKEPVLVFNGKGNILFANRSAEDILKYQEGELQGCNMTRIFQQEFQTDKGEMAPFDIGKLPDGQETAIYLRTSACIPVRIRIFPMDKEGEFFLLAEDLSEQKEMAARIQSLREEEGRNRRERNEFTANVTHELRTPVNGIRGHAEMLMNMTEDPEQRRILDIILYCCSNMSAIINNILDFSKMEAGRFSIDEQEFDFYEMMNKVIAIHTNEINKKELKFSIDVDEQIPRLLIGDEMRISQILNNLLSNAVKFTQVGFVSVAVSMTKQVYDKVELFFMVKDSGIGISREECGRLFQNFSQVDASITRRFGGTGLGLSIARQLVELMNGSIYVESEKGKGSAFSFSIQLHTGQNADEDEKLQEVSRDWNNFVNKGIPPEGQDGTPHFGETEIREELKKRMDRLALSIEMNVWDKAEHFCGTIRLLAGNGDELVRKQILRLEMAVRKENYEKSMKEYGKLKAMLEKHSGEHKAKEQAEEKKV